MTYKSSLRYALLPALAFSLALFARTALADVIDSGGTTPGCDQKVLTAMQDKANARTAYDVASTEQVITKPDSILALTCFNDAAGESALQLGSMFSGDFTTPLSKIVPDSLTAFFDDFKGAPGMDKGTIPYATMNTLGTTTTGCNYIQDLWTEQKAEGIQPDVPYYRYSDLVNTGSMPSGMATAPAATTKFYKDMTTSDTTDNDFGKVNTDIGALQKAATPTTFVPDPVNTDDICATMAKAGITVPVPCP